MEKILQTLKNGEIVAFAGDIGWLIACDTRNQNACENLKNIYLSIPTDKSKTPLTIIFKDIGLLNTYAKGIPEVAWDIIDFEENPLSIIFDVVQGLPITLENTTNTAVRFVKHGQTKDILHKFGRPLLSMIVSADFLKNNAEKNILINYIDTKEETPTPKHTLMRLGEGGDVKFL